MMGICVWIVQRCRSILVMLVAGRIAAAVAAITASASRPVAHRDKRPEVLPFR
jgi:hypothetical protein